ncbi:hypothetical protein B0I35DRAFT_47709 [Stachybotrys elegans]|uniref:Uncharacterized protein n=1 Tax=Stachybotrys elegans TaxID=80388 RepID=A0A8K0T3K3_9HYPO|nr:hypothetical protein B0I35DRAFT_47709 [Stachybotrys elegans]
MRSFVSFSVLALATGSAAKGVWTTPHDKYSSSVGVLGCKINTDRVAYWPGSVDCDNICVKLTNGDRSVHLLRIDQSGGAYDISYDAWSYLQTGESATADPVVGGSVAMEYEEVDASECADLIYTEGSKIPLSASNSMNFLTSCLSQPNSYVAKNHVLFNICDAICTLGHDEECTLDLATSNQPSCPHTLGLTVELTSAPVIDIQYQSGHAVIAGSGDPAPANWSPNSVSVNSAPPKEEPKEEPPSPPPSPPKPAPSSQAPKPSEAPKPSSSPIPSPSPSPEPGIFYEVTGTLVSSTVAAEPTVEVAAPVSSSVEVPAEPSTTALAVPSSSSVEVPEAPSSTVAPSSPVAIPTTASHNSTASFTFAPSASHTTLTFSTGRPAVPSNPATTPGGAPVSSSTPPPDNAANSASIPMLALVSSILACSLASLL